MPTDREIAMLQHRQLWDWLAHHPTALKCEWPGWNDIKFDVYANCFLCQYVIDLTGDVNCDACPGNWGNYENYCNKADTGLYWLWCKSAHDKVARIRYAELIRDLPVRSVA